MTDISERNAQNLIKAFENMAESCAFSEKIMKSYERSLTNLCESKLMHRCVYCNLKHLSASIFTRWYWNKQLSKADKRYLEYKQIFKENE